LQLGLVIVQVSWIEEAWALAHGNNRIEEQKHYVSTVLRRKHAMEGLMGCRVCVTGVPFEERAAMASVITALHGTYSPDLTPQCTHLISESIADATVVPVKIQYAQKWNIPIIGVPWLWACRDTNRLVDEQEYLIKLEIQCEDNTLPIKLEDIPENGCNEFLAGCHIALGEPLAQAQFILLKRLILAAGGARYSAATNIDIPSHLTHWIVSQQQLLASQQSLILPEGALMVHEQWLFDCFKSQERLSEIPYLVNDSKPNRQSEGKVPERKLGAFGKISSSSSSQQNVPLSLQTQQSFYNKETNYSSRPSSSLESLCVYFSKDLPVARRKKLQAKAQKVNIRISSNLSDADLAITPLLVKEKIAADVDAYTDWWLEASLNANELLPDSEAYSRPIVFSANTDKNRNLVLSQSGFTGLQRELHVELIRMAGATYTDSFSRINTHLLLAAKNGSKYEFACKWGIQCVTLGELKELLFEVSGEENRKKEEKGTSLSNSFSLTFSQPLQVSLAKSPDAHSQSACLTTFSSVDGLLKGKIFAMSQRLWHRRDELSNLVESMGGIFLWSFDRGATHYLHQGNRDQEPFREFTQAQAAGQKIVSPLWLVACKEACRVVDEAAYPHTLKATDEKENMPILRAANYLPENPKDIRIDWDAIVAEKRAREQQLRPMTKVDLSALMKNSSSNNGESPYSAAFLVALTGYSSVEREELRVKLPPSFEFAIEPVTWDRSRMVLLCKQPALSEKFMCACASGSWIIGDVAGLLSWKSGVYSSNILEKFEVVPSGYGVATPADHLLMAAPRKWRKSVQRAFEGWYVLLWASSSTGSSLKALGQYERILIAGGAQVTYEPNSSISHVFYLDDEVSPPVNFDVPIHPLRWLVDVLFK